MGHAKVSNTAFRTECCFPFLITKTTIQQRCPWPLHIYGGLREISLPPPWALITPGHSSLVTHWGHPAPVTAPSSKGSLDALSPFNSCSRKSGGEESVQGKWELNEEQWEDGMDQGEGRWETTSSPLCGPEQGSSKLLLSAFFILWACQGQSFQLPLAHIKEYWLQRSIELEAL